MTLDPMWIWIAAAAVAILIAIGLIASGIRRSRTARLRQRFGAEYDAVLRRTGNRVRTERELLERTEEAKALPLRALTAEERKRYRDDWSRIEARFVERPTTSVAEADEVIRDILRVQGYPPDFDRRVAHLSIKSPILVQHYRAGHEIIGRGGAATTEDLRQAMLHYRALFDALVGMRGEDVAKEILVSRELEAPAVREHDMRMRREEERL